jgi:hypothetical protein
MKPGFCREMDLRAVCIGGSSYRKHTTHATTTQKQAIIVKTIHPTAK